MLSNLFLSVLDPVNARIHGNHSEELRAALNRHHNWPVGRVLADRVDFADFLNVLEADEDHAEEHSDALKDDDVDDCVRTWRILIRVRVVLEVLVDSLDQVRAHDDIEDDEYGEVCRGGKVDI